MARESGRGRGSFQETFAITDSETRQQRNRVAIAKQREWAKTNLPSLPEPYVMGNYEVLRYTLGREPTPAEVEERVRIRMEALKRAEAESRREQAA